MARDVCKAKSIMYSDGAVKALIAEVRGVLRSANATLNNPESIE